MSGSIWLNHLIFFIHPIERRSRRESSSMAEDLVLDTAIRDWVLIPLSVVMVLIGVLRYFVSKLMRSSPTPDAKMVKEGQVVIRARNLKAGASFIPPKSFRARRFYFSNEENGLLHVPKDQAQNPQAQMFSDPNMAMDMMKKNLSMIIPQTLTFAWVNFFFSGFVAAKIPFPLTQRFRSMLQNGIDLSTVDVSYVSGRSWYVSYGILINYQPNLIDIFYNNHH
ncbi:ER membrane protein complex subunit 3 isoform X3 [Brassica rapa]|uniref:ER membrane protein complex subunit 3 isoform X2 n=1 Tax=Brassica campestris TaxID=3711 RepID=UPI00142E8E9E|nr:ER membrane protein complex subunit 3 isoform X2 [Brassica rapa]XP_033131053.1 ER membrane protein complex subunit 3 isoform X3 [Brassica rapa]